MVVLAIEPGLPPGAKAYIGVVGPVVPTVNKVPNEPSTLAAAVPEAFAALVVPVKPVHAEICTASESI